MKSRNHAHRPGYFSAYHQQRQARGLCPLCGKPNLGRYYRCLACRVRDGQRRKARAV